MLHATDVIPNMTTIIIAVFVFQLAGCAYHPPAGDQTCLGYLRGKKRKVSQWKQQHGNDCKMRLDRRWGTHGIFPPLEWETEAPFASTVLVEWSFSMFGA